jgi:hypothetical protein
MAGLAHPCSLCAEDTNTCCEQCTDPETTAKIAALYVCKLCWPNHVQDKHAAPKLNTGCKFCGGKDKTLNVSGCAAPAANFGCPFCGGKK